MTQRNFEVGDVVVQAGTNASKVVVELLDDSLVWVCALEDCKVVDLIETANLIFISKGGHACCKRLRPKAHRFPIG